MALYVQIVCDAPEDPKMIDAGPIAELLYYRCVMKCRALLTDGIIDRRRLPRFAAGIPGKIEKVAAKLVEVGLWEVHPDGWMIPERVWKKFNPTSAEIEEMRAVKKEAGELGNHERHHAAKGVRSQTCRFCLADASHGAKGCDVAGSPKGKPEGEGKPKGKVEEEVCGPPVEATDKPPAPPDKKKPLAPKPDGGVLEFPITGPCPHRSWWLCEEKIQQYRESYPGLDLDAELRAARQWCIDNPTNRKTPDGMFAFLARWLKKEQNQSRAAPKSPRSPNTSPARIQPPERKYADIPIIDATPPEDRTTSAQGS